MVEEDVVPDLTKNEAMHAGLYVSPKNNKRVPIIIDIQDGDEIFTIRNREQKIIRVKQLLTDENSEICNKLLQFINESDVVCAQISQANSEISYKKHITDVINANNSGTPYSVDLQKSLKNKSNWQLFLDNRENRLCFVIWCIDENLY